MCINRLSLFTECYITQRFLSVPNPNVAYRQEIACRTLISRGPQIAKFGPPKNFGVAPSWLKSRGKSQLDLRRWITLPGTLHSSRLFCFYIKFTCRGLHVALPVRKWCQSGKFFHIAQSYVMVCSW